MYPWKSVLSVENNPKRPKYLQIADQVIKEITSGRLHPAQKVPGSRKMAELLGLNRKTVIQAYEELMAQGWLEIRSSSGTYISEKLPLPSYIRLKGQPTHEEAKHKIFLNTFSHIDGYSAAPKNGLVVDGGSPDHRLAPLDWIFKECRALAKSRYHHRLLTYSDVRGEPVLRATLARYLSESRGMHVTKSHILITRGSQMGIFLALKGLIRTGDAVVVGDSSYDAADWAVQYHEGQLHRVTVDDMGLDTGELEKLCQNVPVKLVYITPHHHFPTTVTLSNDRRIHLLELAFRHNFTILEDDYDYDFHYSSSPLLPLASLDHRGHVVYIGSFSKIFAPNIRVGYLVGSPEMVEELSKVRRIIDRQGDHLVERVIAEAIVSGELGRHLKKSVTCYHHRRDHLAGLLTHHLGNHLSFKVPEGGMAIWTRFNRIPLLALKPVIHEKNLYLDIDRDLARKFNAVRLGFASLNDTEQQEVVGKLKEVVEEFIATNYS